MSRFLGGTLERLFSAFWGSLNSSCLVGILIDIAYGLHSAERSRESAYYLCIMIEKIPLISKSLRLTKSDCANSANELGPLVLGKRCVGLGRLAYGMEVDSLKTKIPQSLHFGFDFLEVLLKSLQEIPLFVVE